MQDSELDKFIEDVQMYGIAHILKRFYSVYRAFVTRTDDPDGKGCVQVRVPFAHIEQLDIWIDPVFLGAGGDRGFFWPPEVGDTVWVVFQEGNTRQPIAYFGSWHSAAEMPSEFAYTKEGDSSAPDVRGFITRLGHRIIFTDTPGKEQLEISWHRPAPGDPSLMDRSKSADRGSGKTASLLFGQDNVVLLKDSGGQSVKLDPNGGVVEISDANNNVITMNSQGITIQSNGKIKLKGTSIDLDAPQVDLCSGAITPFVKGNELVTYLASHTHVAAAPGAPTSTPIPPPIGATLLSTKIKGG